MALRKSKLGTRPSRDAHEHEQPRLGPSRGRPNRHSRSRCSKTCSGSESRTSVLDHPDTLKSMNDLAAAYLEMKRWGDAEALAPVVLWLCARSNSRTTGGASSR